MAPRAAFFIPAFLALAVASLDGSVPACGTPCLSDTVSASTTCAADDNRCICEMVYTVKRNSESCLRSKCSESEYGQVMSGIDAFCKGIGSGTSPSGTAGLTQPPSTGYPTGQPPVEATSTSAQSATYPTEQPPASSSIEASSSTEGLTVSASLPILTLSSSLPPAPSTPSGQQPTTAPTTQLPPAVPTTSNTAVTTGLVTTPSVSHSSSSASSTPTQSPIAAGNRQGTSYAALAVGVLAAAFFAL